MRILVVLVDRPTFPKGFVDVRGACFVIIGGRRLATATDLPKRQITAGFAATEGWDEMGWVEEKRVVGSEKSGQYNQAKQRAV